MQTIGLYLRGLRTGQGLTQAEAAKLIDVSAKTIERWEAGKNRPSGPTLVMYVQSLGGEIEELLRQLGSGINLFDEDEDMAWFAALSPEQKRKARALLDAAEGRLLPRE